MLAKDNARLLIEHWLKLYYVQTDVDLVVVDSLTLECQFGWVFFYDSKKSLESKNLKDELIGNAPIIVNKWDGSLLVTGTAHSVEHYIDNYERYGTPHPPETAQEDPPSAQ